MGYIYHSLFTFFLPGFTEVDLLMAALLLAVEEHQLAVEQDSAEEQQRIAREKVIMEQDRAYQESLAQDKQKVSLFLSCFHVF